MSKTLDFQQFWDAYSRAYGCKRDRYKAERAWARLSARDRRDAFMGIIPYRDRCLADGISMMYGQGYLTHRRWEDEGVAPSPATSKTATPCASPQGSTPPQKGNIPPSLPLKGLTPWQTQDDTDTPPDADALEAMATW